MAKADYDYSTCTENVVVRLSGAASQNRLEGSEADEAIMMPEDVIEATEHRTSGYLPFAAW